MVYLYICKKTHLFVERVEEDSSLNSLSKTHLISQDGICALSPRKTQPVQSLQLVWVKCAARRVQIIRLPIKLYSGLKVRDRKNISSLTVKTYSYIFFGFKTMFSNNLLASLIIILMVTLEITENYRKKGAMVCICIE